MSKDQRWKEGRARRRVIRDLVRRQLAPVPESEVTELLLEIRVEVMGLELPKSDADWFYKKMLRDRWTLDGVPIEDWRFTVASMHKHRYFPSQR